MTYIVLIMSIFDLLFNNDKNIIRHNYLDEQINISINDFKEEKEEYDNYLRYNTWNGEDKEIIIKKVNRYLNSTLKDKGQFIVEYSISKGIDPYLTVSVMLQETGCRWTCSYLTRVCNNVGGNKGTPSCNGGSYRKFDTIEEGIKFAINKLNSYYKKGITDPKDINKYYASDKTWYKKVNNYMKKIKRG